MTVSRNTVIVGAGSIVLLIALAAVFVWTQQSDKDTPAPTAAPIVDAPSTTSQKFSDLQEQVGEWTGGTYFVPENEMPSGFVQAFISSGIFEQRTLSDGVHTVQAEIVQAYTTNKSGDVLIVPVVFGTITDNESRSFTELLDIESTRAMLARGCPFTAYVTHFVQSPYQIEWDKCASSGYFFADEATCSLALSINDAHPRAINQMIYDGQPASDWVLYGWGLDTKCDVKLELPECEDVYCSH